MVEQGGESADTLTGSPSDDTLRGAGGNDSIVAGAGDDLLEGGDGNDTLQGDRGFDTLRGGAGDDTYFINDLDDYWVEPEFGGLDRLVISVNGAKVPYGTHVEIVDYVNNALRLAYWVDALVYGASWGYMGEPQTVRYGFATGHSRYQGFQAFDEGDREATRLALATWAAPTQLSWQEVAPELADVVFGFAELDDEDAAGITDYGVADEPVAVLVDNDAVGGTLAASDYWFDVLLHEIGHALWLKHPGDYNGSDGRGELPFLGSREDNDDNTVMSYHAGPLGGLARQLRPLDVAAAQYLYGVNPSLNAGDTVYRFEELAWPRTLLADGGGIDTLDASGLSPVPAGAGPALVLELRPGALSGPRSMVGAITRDGAVSINYHTQIENAIGSRFNDSITGNDANNRLEGGAGADSVFGLAGDDTLVGGEGDDLLDGGLGRNSLRGGEGDDTFNVVVGRATTVDGGAGVDTARVEFDSRTLSTAMVHELMALIRAPQAAGALDSLQLQFAGIERLSFVDEDGVATDVPRPVAFAASYSLAEGATLLDRLPTPYVFDDQPPRYMLAWPPTHGELNIQADGSLRYTPIDPDFFGGDSFSYYVWDARSGSKLQSVTLTITPVDDAPRLRGVAPDQTATLGVPFSASFPASLFVDIDSPSIQWSVVRADGSALPPWLSFNTTTLTLSGTAGPNDAGMLQLRLVASDGTSASSDEFMLGVWATANRIPSAPAGPLPVDEDAVLETQLTATDPDGDAISYALVSQPAHGSAALSASGWLRYAPHADYFGADSVLVMVSDGRGGAAQVPLALQVRSVNDVPRGSLSVFGMVRLGGDLFVSDTLSDPDGKGSVSAQWLRDGQPIAGATALGYRAVIADVGKQLSVSVSWLDAGGFTERVSALAQGLVLGAESVVGSSADEWLNTVASAQLSGLAGNDTLSGGPADDTLLGGVGNDRLFVDAGDDVLDGGEGFDKLEFMAQVADVRIDLQRGLMTSSLGQDTLRNIEAVMGSSGDDHMRGRDGPARLRGEYFLPRGGNDTIDGGEGVDQVEIDWPSGYSLISFDPTRREVLVQQRYAPNPERDVLISIERLRFNDQLLAFGERAEQVAQVAFALWSKDILASRYLFARGISYYDVGYSFEQLCTAAITFFADDSDARFAQRLADNVQGTRTASDVLALMNGAGGGAAGRAHATQVMAQDGANLRHIELSGLITNGIACDLHADGQLLFPSLLG